MFTWDKSIEKIGASSDQVLHLFRSMRDVQLALPGQAVQEASAFLCQVQRENGVATYAVFHLHKNDQLAFYLSDPREVAEKKAELMLDKGLNFVESMGFLLTDMDLHLLTEQDREMLWGSLPLTAGLTSTPAQEPPAEKAAAPRKPSPEPSAESFSGKAESAPQAPAAAVPSAEPSPVPVAAPSVPPTGEPEQGEESVDDLLAAVEALRAKRPGVRPRRKVLKPAEIRKRQEELRETIGRLLASL